MVPTRARRGESRRASRRATSAARTPSTTGRSGEAPARRERTLKKGKFGSSGRPVTTRLASRSRSSRARERSSPRLGDAEFPARAARSRWHPPATRVHDWRSPRWGARKPRRGHQEF
jgi:hypothetical protein